MDRCSDCCNLFSFVVCRGKGEVCNRYMIHDLVFDNVSLNNLVCRGEGWSFTEPMHMVLQCQPYCSDGRAEFVMYAF